jgi:hypothetical protein
VVLAALVEAATVELVQRSMDRTLVLEGQALPPLVVAVVVLVVLATAATLATTGILPITLAVLAVAES